jgi:hypothetical protein
MESDIRRKCTPTAEQELLDELGYLTDPQLCAVTAWSPQTLRNRRSSGKAPPSSKVGRRHLTKKTDLAAWVARRRAA